MTKDSALNRLEVGKTTFFKGNEHIVREKLFEINI